MSTLLDGITAVAQHEDNVRRLKLVEDDVAECFGCELSNRRKNTVFACGHPTASIVLVGEAPGEQEDERGIPFVGPAGKKLDKMLVEAGLDPERDVYIVNAIKCRPPSNRKPEEGEIEACALFLKRQLEIVRPRCLVALGATAAYAILGSSEGITKIRGSWRMVDGVPVMPTLHPSYVLRSPPAKKDVVADLRAVAERFGPREGKTS